MPFAGGRTLGRYGFILYVPGYTLYVPTPINGVTISSAGQSLLMNLTSFYNAMPTMSKVILEFELRGGNGGKGGEDTVTTFPGGKGGYGKFRGIFTKDELTKVICVVGTAGNNGTDGETLPGTTGITGPGGSTLIHGLTTYPLFLGGAGYGNDVMASGGGADGGGFTGLFSSSIIFSDVIAIVGGGGGSGGSDDGITPGAAGDGGGLNQNGTSGTKGGGGGGAGGGANDTAQGGGGGTTTAGGTSYKGSSVATAIGPVDGTQLYGGYGNNGYLATSATSNYTSPPGGLVYTSAGAGGGGGGGYYGGGGGGTPGGSLVSFQWGSGGGGGGGSGWLKPSGAYKFLESTVGGNNTGPRGSIIVRWGYSTL